MGLCQKSPTCPAVTSLTNKILGETFETGVRLSVTAGMHSKTRHSLAIAVCESLRTTTSQDLLVSVFPLLCRLTSVDNDGLRRAAGKILGGMNLSEVITRERERADQANARAKEIEEENIAMLEEIEYLQAENEELQRQVSQSCPPPLYLLFVSVYSLHVAVGCIFRELIILLRPWSLSARIDE
jgi:hypothetical protein